MIERYKPTSKNYASLAGYLAAANAGISKTKIFTFNSFTKKLQESLHSEGEKFLPLKSLLYFCLRKAAESTGNYQKKGEVSPLISPSGRPIDS